MTLEVTKDPFPPELRTKLAQLAKVFPMRVPLTYLMGKIKRHDDARKCKISAVNQQWSFTRSPSGWPMFTGITSFLIIIGIGYLIYRCCRAVPQGPIGLAIGGAIPKGAAREIGRAAEGEKGQYPTTGTEATTAALLAIVLVLVWKKR